VFQIQIQNGNIVTSDKDGGKLPHWNIAPEGHPRRHSSECSSHRNAHSTDDICRTSTSNRDTSPQCGERGKEEGENRAASSEVEVVNTSSESDLDRVHSSSESTLQSSTATSIPDELSLGDRRGDSPLVDGGLTPVVEDDGRDTPLVDGGITPLADDGRRDTPLAEDGLTPLVEERGLGHLISDSGGESPKGHPPLKATKCIGENPEDVDPTLSSEGNEGTLKKESVISASGIFLSFSTSPDMQNSLGDIAEVHEEDNPAVLLRSDQRHSHSDSPGDRELPKQRSLSSGTVLDESMAAADLARKLYTLDGIKKEAVAKHLSIKSNFGSIVAKEYVEHFNFEGATLDEALRTFLSSFALVGESQEIDRIMNHFSQRYFEENPWSFPSKDTIHAVVSAMLLLNSDLHKEHGNAKMTSSQFVSNIMQLEVEFPQNKKDFHKFLRTLYDSIKRDPIKFISDSDDTLSERGISPASEPDHTTPPSGVRMYKVNVPGSFVEVELPGDSPVFKEGQVMRKNVMEGPHKKVPRGHRGWKGYHAYLKGFLLYFSEPHSELRLEDTRNALPIMNCLATNAHDYSKKSAVLRVTTSDWHVFLLQASNMLEVQQWITAINRSAATYSSPPLAAAVGSGTITKFVRPMFPLRPTANNLEEQGKSHLDMIASLEKELEEHRKIKPSGKGTGGRTADWFDKYEYLQYEISRYRIYHVSLTSDVDISQLNAPLPSMLMPSPSTLTLATANADTWSRYRSPPSPTPSSSSYRGSPLLRRKQYYNKN
jgi:PH/SEC7 domain-containing protein